MSDATIAPAIVGAHILAARDAVLAQVVCATVRRESSDSPASAVQFATARGAGPAGNQRRRIASSSNTRVALSKAGTGQQ